MAFLVKIFAFFVFASCTFEPGYKTPEAGVTLEDKTQNQVSWGSIFLNLQIKNLLGEAVKENKDLKIAHLNIDLAKEQFGPQTSPLLPSLSASFSGNKASPQTSPQYTALLSAYYEVDLFGRLRSLRASAKELVLAQEEGKNIIFNALVKEVTSTYITLLYYQKSVKTYEDMLNSYQELSTIYKLQKEEGLTSELEVISLNTSINQIKIALEDARLNFAKNQTKINLLMGKTYNYETLEISEILLDESLLQQVPSSMLLLRPDVMQAENKLKSANANIGVARAAFFPSISLTGAYGLANNELSGLFSQGSTVWNFVPKISIPLFAGGVNFSNLKISKINKEIMLETYTKTVQTAFKDSLDAINSRTAMLEILNIKKATLRNSKNYAQILKSRYNEGLANKAELLKAEIQLLSSEMEESFAKTSYLFSVIYLYNSLGLVKAEV